MTSENHTFNGNDKLWNNRKNLVASVFQHVVYSLSR